MPNIVGTTGDDILVGTPQADDIQGLAGSDSLDGGGGTDVLKGGSGNDYYIVDSADDQVIEVVGEGYDIVFAKSSYALTAGQEIESLGVLVPGATTALDLTGNGFNNRIIGNAGVNSLDGGAGADDLYGGAGNDYYIVDNAGDRTFETAGEGYDIVFAKTSYTLTVGQEIESLGAYDPNATTALDLNGNEFANRIIGNAGSNSLDGRAGADDLYGGAGNDYYIVDNAGDRTFEAMGQGYDIVFAKASYTLAVGQEIESLGAFDPNATTALDLNGNEFANRIIGNAGSNSLDGRGGADDLYGGAGNDYYIVDNAGDRTFETVGQGYEIVFAKSSYTLTAGQEIESLGAYDPNATTALDLNGNEFANRIIGNAGSNTLDGGAGADELYGGAGNDYYVVDNAGDRAFEAAGEGYDIVFAKSSHTLLAGQEIESLGTLTPGATTAIDLTGNEFANLIVGNAGSNTINGGAGADTLYGEGGNDFLDGGTGMDILTGGAGTDMFRFTTAPGAGNVDTITDFTVTVDEIELAGSAGQPFAALASGTLRTESFVLGSAALDANDYIIYNSSTGALLYDADGNGAGGAVHFATLAAGLNLTAGDVQVAGPANHQPAITSGPTAAISENSPVSTIVYQAQATDADGDRITWSLTGTDANLFTIDANGAVRLINPADYESKTSYGFSIVAADSNTSNSQIVTVNVIDVNESGPSTPIFNETAAPNDNQGSAQAIDRNLFVVASNPNLPNASLPSGTIAGRVASFTDGDYYSITLQAGEKIVLDVDNTSEGLDSQIFLYDSSGTLLTSNDDKGTPDPGSGIQFGHNTDSYLDFRVATSGTYYFKIAAFSGSGQQSLGNYQLHVSIAPVATPAQIAQEKADKNIDALISGDMWDHLNLTYGFPSSAGQYPTQFDELSNNFEGFNSDQIGATQQLLTMIASVSQLTFAPNSFQPGQANLRFAMSDEAEVAYAYYPTNDGPNSIGGTAWFRNSPIGNRPQPSWDHPVRGDYAWMGILHETGHTLGLKHGHADDPGDTSLTSDRDSVEFSVMTYRSYVGGDLEGYSNEKFGYPQTLMQYDIGALQRTYGANFNFNAGDSVYSWSPGTGEMSINGAPMGAPGANRVFMTIWDGGGNDTYNLSNYTNGTTIDLRPGEWSKTSQVQLADLGDGNDARGNIANALLYNGNSASLIENAIAGPGNDLLVANQAANQLTGGDGADVFRWMTIDDAGVGALADILTDFVRGTDKIDFSQLDAIPTTLPRDAFAFIGTSAFHNVVGEVRYDVIGGSAHIFADADGNGVADMEIVVNNITILAGSDFNF